MSVVVPTFQRCACVQALLTDFRHQSMPPEDFEVIVSVDGSTDETLEMVRSFPSRYSLQAIWNPNRGRAAACNAGIGEAGGDLILLLDDDMRPQPNLLSAHLTSHHGSGPAGVMGAVPIPAECQQSPVQQYIANRFNRHLDKLSRADHHLELRDFYSGNFSIERSVLLGVGGFDESFTIYGNEDLELSLRLRAAGVDLRYCPEAVAYQQYTKNFRALAQDTMAKGRTSLLLASKHPDARPRLRLATYDQASWRWRLARSFLLRAGLWAPGMRLPLSKLADALAHLLPSRLDTIYGLTLDYFYWLGVALEERAREEKPAPSTLPTRGS